MGHSSIRIAVRRRKVAQLAANSRKYTVRNCTIPPKLDKKQLLKYGGTPEEYHKIRIARTRQLPKGRKKPWYMLTKKELSMFHEKYTPKKMGTAELMEREVQHIMNKWKAKHPKAEQDLFNKEEVAKWEKNFEETLERVRNFVVSVHDKLPLIGRYKQSEDTYVEKQITEIKDINAEGHKVGYLKDNSKLLKKAIRLTTADYRKNKNLVCGLLKDHKRKQARIVLPAA